MLVRTNLCKQLKGSRAHSHNGFAGLGYSLSSNMIYLHMRALDAVVPHELATQSLVIGVVIGVPLRCERANKSQIALLRRVLILDRCEHDVGLCSILNEKAICNSMQLHLTTWKLHEQEVRLKHGWGTLLTSPHQLVVSSELPIALGVCATRARQWVHGWVLQHICSRA